MEIEHFRIDVMPMVSEPFNGRMVLRIMVRGKVRGKSTSLDCERWFHRNDVESLFDCLVRDATEQMKKMVREAGQ